MQGVHPDELVAVAVQFDVDVVLPPPTHSLSNQTGSILCARRFNHLQTGQARTITIRSCRPAPTGPIASAQAQHMAAHAAAGGRGTAAKAAAHIIIPHGIQGSAHERCAWARTQSRPSFPPFPCSFLSFLSFPSFHSRPGGAPRCRRCTRTASAACCTCCPSAGRSPPAPSPPPRSPPRRARPPRQSPWACAACRAAAGAGSCGPACAAARTARAPRRARVRPSACRPGRPRRWLAASGMQAGALINHAAGSAGLLCQPRTPAQRPPTTIII